MTFVLWTTVATVILAMINMYVRTRQYLRLFERWVLTMDEDLREEINRRDRLDKRVNVAFTVALVCQALAMGFAW